VPVQQATSAAEFARHAGEAMLGRAGPAAFAVIVVVSILASALALLIMAPRLYLAMSDDGLFPSPLATVNTATSPARATALLALIASVFVSVATFQQIVAFFMCTSLVFVALAAAALLVVRRTSDEAAFRAPGYPVSTALFVALVLVVVALLAINRPQQAILGFGIVLFGVPAHRLLARHRTGAVSEMVADQHSHSRRSV